MPFVTEIVTFTASEAYVADNAVIYPTLRKVLEADGAIRCVTPHGHAENIQYTDHLVVQRFHWASSGRSHSRIFLCWLVKYILG